MGNQPTGPESQDSFTYMGKYDFSSRPLIPRRFLEMQKKAGLDAIELRVIENAEPIALGTREGNKNLMVISNGLLELLNDREITAVMGHELSHLKHGWTHIMLYPMAPNGIRITGAVLGVLIAKQALDHTPLGVIKPKQKDPKITRRGFLEQTFKGAMGGFTATAINIFVPNINKALCRDREFTADREAVFLSGDASAMIVALNKCYDWYKVHGLKVDEDSHPPLTERIAAIRKVDIEMKRSASTGFSNNI